VSSKEADIELLDLVWILGFGNEIGKSGHDAGSLG